MRPEYKRRWDRDHTFLASDPGANKFRSPVRPKELAEMRELRAQGMRTWEIADVTGRSRATVSKYTKGIA